MSFEVGYYFKHQNKLPVDGLFEDVTDAYEILGNVKPVLDRILVSRYIKLNYGAMKSVNIHYYGNYHIGANTVIYNGVTIMGPVYIGKNCEIMPGAIIRPYTIIGDNCFVGHGSEIKNSVLFSGAKVASLAFVGDSVLGASARIGSGVITANRKFDQSDIILKNGEDAYNAGDYFGLILGDSSRIGANSVTQPGTHIGPNSWVYPMTTVRGFIPREKRIYHARELKMEDNGIIELKP